VIDFLVKSPTLDTKWRAIVLFGRNVASYKFALAKTLLDMADRSDERVPLEELAGPYARHVAEHLARVDKQATSRSSKFLDACRDFNRSDGDQTAHDKLIAATVDRGFANVIDAFHRVGAADVSVLFCRRAQRRSWGHPADGRNASACRDAARVRLE
jgi:hypothetical protein